jgi:hypothetical protein
MSSIVMDRATAGALIVTGKDGVSPIS